jgi:Rrf2 family protein
MNGLLGVGDMAAMALHAMGLVAVAEDNDAPLSASRVAEQLKASLHTARIVMHRLAQAGLVNTVHGRQGGFRLGRPAARISLWDVVEVFEPRGQQHGCLFAKPVCAKGTPCPFAPLASDLQHRIEAYLRRTSLNEIAAIVAGKK